MLQNPSKSSGFSDLIYDMVIDCSDKEGLIRVGRCEEMIDDKGEEFGIARGGESRLIKALSTLRIRKLYNWNEWSYDDRTTTGFLSRQLGESIDIHITEDICHG